MKYQSNASSCGPNALANALEIMGFKRTEAFLAKLAGTDPVAGTSEGGLIAAAQEVTKAFLSAGDAVLLDIAGALALGGAAVVAVDNDEHWVAVVAHTAGRYIVVDGAATELVQVKNTKQLLRRMRNAAGEYCAIILYK